MLVGGRIIAVSSGDRAVMALLIQHLDLKIIAISSMIALVPVLAILLPVAFFSIPSRVALDSGFAAQWRPLLGAVAVSFLVAQAWSTSLNGLWWGSLLPILVFSSLFRLLRRSAKDVTLLVIGWGVCPLVVGSTSFGPWLPAERVQLNDGRSGTIYVLNETNPMTVVWVNGPAEYLNQSSIARRDLCNIGPSQNTFGAINRTLPCP